MNWLRKALMIALAAGVGFVISVPLAGAETATQGKNQCYHYSWEPQTACSTCADTCLGGGYKCCTILVDP